MKGMRVVFGPHCNAESCGNVKRMFTMPIKDKRNVFGVGVGHCTKATLQSNIKHWRYCFLLQLLLLWVMWKYKESRGFETLTVEGWGCWEWWNKNSFLCPDCLMLIYLGRAPPPPPPPPHYRDLLFSCYESTRSSRDSLIVSPEMGGCRWEGRV